ncbi:mitogen-activated protein kinase kinase kinase 2 [Biomphalaria glabrata]|nr:mitogen-activated protein kinase kinase kinase 2 [Biomphalaria glabrata]
MFHFPDNCISDKLPKDWERGRLLGQGGFGKVYLMIDKTKPSDELYVVKDIPISPTARKKEKTLREFRRETEILMILKEHERIVPFYGNTLTDTVASLFFGYMKSGSLYQYYINRGKLNELQCIAYAKQILEGLCYLHERRIIHRDIKGANILLENEEHLRLTDFGISKIVKKTTAGITLEVGTNRWIAPEVYDPRTKNKDYNFKADIWSVGCTIVEMITGGVPYAEIEEVHAVIYEVGCGKPPTWPNTISEELNDILEDMFKSNPIERCSAEQLLIKLNNISDLTYADTKNWLKRIKLYIRAAKRKVLGTIEKILQIKAEDRIKADAWRRGNCSVGAKIAIVAYAQFDVLSNAQFDVLSNAQFDVLSNAQFDVLSNAQFDVLSNAQFDVLSNAQFDVLSNAQFDVLSNAQFDVLSNAQFDVLSNAQFDVLSNAQFDVLSNAQFDVLSNAQFDVLSNAQFDVLSNAQFDVLSNAPNFQNFTLR